MDVFMAPRSVAIIGASRKTGEGSFNVIENMKEFGFQGKIYPVNPLADEIMGKRTYREITEIGEPIDVAIISTPREQIPRIVEDCATLGIKGAIVVPQGFADADEEGKILQDQLVQIAHQRGIRILGPNTLGVINAFSGFTSSFMSLRRKRTPVGVICQSGIFFVGSALFTGMMGKGIDLGNGCDLDFADALEYFGKDDQIEVVFAHIEGMREGRRFFEVAQKVARHKPIVALKTAKTEPGAFAASSHSGALVGDHEIFEAAFRQAGIIAAHNPEEVLDYTKTLLHLPPMQGKGVGVITFTGAGGIILIDALHEYGLELAELSPTTIQKIKDLSPPWMPIQNPLDIWPALMKHGMNYVYGTALREVLQDPSVDGVICIAIAPQLPDHAYLDATGVIRETASSLPEKPVVTWLYGPNQALVSQRLEEDGNVISFPTLPRAARTLAALYGRQLFLQQTSSPPPKFSVEKKGRDVLSRCQEKGDTKIEGEAAQVVLEGYGIPMARSRLCGDLREALQAAEEIGYPVVLKISSPQIIHKTDARGIVLNLQGPMELEEAYTSLIEGIKKRTPVAKVEGVLVQEMMASGIEVILGAKRDRQFGPALIFGTGGIYTEVWKDISYGIAPLTPQDARRMIRETRCFQLLKGARGEKGYDIDLIVDCLLRLSQLMLEAEEIQEIDINPFVALPRGGAAVDVRMIVGKRET
ncbi:MAG: acetate--CoA ligase family protein [Deltaproteobacteria bacterium]|nr:MAG: acetate--CoA ligase family protein [Deltaproteobacteria bacterium]